MPVSRLNPLLLPTTTDPPSPTPPPPLTPTTTGLPLHIPQRYPSPRPNRQFPPPSPPHKDPRSRLHPAPSPPHHQPLDHRPRLGILRHPRRDPLPLPRQHLLPQLRDQRPRRPVSDLRHPLPQRLPLKVKAGHGCEERGETTHQYCTGTVQSARRAGVSVEPGVRGGAGSE